MAERTDTERLSWLIQRFDSGDADLAVSEVWTTASRLCPNDYDEVNDAQKWFRIGIDIEMDKETETEATP